MGKHPCFVFSGRDENETRDASGRDDEDRGKSVDDRRDAVTKRVGKEKGKRLERGACTKIGEDEIVERNHENHERSAEEHRFEQGENHFIKRLKGRGAENVGSFGEPRVDLDKTGVESGNDESEADHYMGKDDGHNAKRDMEEGKIGKQSDCQDRFGNHKIEVKEGKLLFNFAADKKEKEHAHRHEKAEKSRSKSDDERIEEGDPQDRKSVV